MLQNNGWKYELNDLGLCYYDFILASLPNSLELRKVYWHVIIPGWTFIFPLSKFISHIFSSSSLLILFLAYRQRAYWFLFRVQTETKANSWLAHFRLFANIRFRYISNKNFTPYKAGIHAWIYSFANGIVDHFVVVLLLLSANIQKSFYLL